MKIISIANRKGGVGKTVISANLAYELSKMGYLVLMVDLDSQCDLSKIYLQGDYEGGNIFHLLRQQCSIDNACLEVGENLYLIPGSRDIVHFDFRGSEGILLHYLRNERLEEVDFVIIDHPPALSESALAGFVASDEVVIVSDAEAFSVANLGQLLDDLAHIQKVMNRDLHILGILVNKIDRRRKLTKVMVEEVYNSFGNSVFRASVGYDSAVPTAIRKGVPVRKLAWHSRALGQIRHLTKEVIERLGMANGNG